VGLSTSYFGANNHPFIAKRALVCRMGGGDMCGKKRTKKSLSIVGLVDRQKSTSVLENKPLLYYHSNFRLNKVVCA
jgi:hypothetical protein